MMTSASQALKKDAQLAVARGAVFQLGCVGRGLSWRFDMLPRPPARCK